MKAATCADSSANSAAGRRTGSRNHPAKARSPGRMCVSWWFSRCCAG